LGLLIAIAGSSWARLLRGVREVVYTTLAVLVEIGWPGHRGVTQSCDAIEGELAISAAANHGRLSQF